MSKYQQRPFRSTLRRALYAGLGIPILASPWAFAQTAGDDSAIKLDKIEITGSRIATADTVGAAPVQTVDSTAIQSVGATDVLEALKRVSSSFTGSGNTARDVNNGGGGEAYIALRNLPTLVLLNGRRLANSAFSNGAAVDVNTIPVAMVDRIEVLKDGASAIYGSDAIGGVVNVITKKNYTGVEISGRYGFSTETPDFNEYQASIVAGTSTEKSSFMAGGTFYRSTPLVSSDRNSVAGLDIADLIANNMTPPSYMSPSFPTRVDNYILAGSPFAVGAAGYNPAITTPPVQPGTPYANMAAYLTANPGAYIPIGTAPRAILMNSVTVDGVPMGALFGYPILNTAEFGTYSLQSQDRRQVFASGEHELIGKEVQLFGSFLYANTHSEAALAPSPVSNPATSNMLIPANNMYNPFQRDLGTSDYGGSSTPRARTRYVDSGLRLFDTDGNYYQFTSGFKGDLQEGKYGYELAYNYGRSETLQTTKNAINGAALDYAMQPNVDPALAATGLSRLRSPVTGNYVPMFNHFSWGGNSMETVDALRSTLFQEGISEMWGVDGVITGAPVKLPAGELGFAVGAGWYQESLATLYDPLTEIGKVPGLNPAASFPGGSRDAYNVFAEVKVPIFTEEENGLPGLEGLELTAAGRYENFDPGGDKTVPKVGIRWQPLKKDWIGQTTLRASYSQSFLAPTVYQLFGSPAASFPVIQTADGARNQQQVQWISTPSLTPGEAETMTAGIVHSPKWLPGLTVSVDYYKIKTENDVYRISEAVMTGALNNGDGGNPALAGSASQYAQYYRFDNGTALQNNATGQLIAPTWGVLQQPLANGAEQATDGLDFSIVYEKATETAGKFTLYGNANWLFSYEYSDPDAGGPFNYEGQFTDGNYGISGAQGTLPDFTINTGIIWQYKDFTVAVNSRYVPGVESQGDLHPSIGDVFNYATIDGSSWQVDDWWTIDVQVAYEIGKTKIMEDPSSKKWFDQTRFAVGCNNITDNLPPLVAGSTEDNTDKGMYDIVGRYLYFEVSKKF